MTEEAGGRECAGSESRVFLRAFEPEDHRRTIKWRSDPDVFSMVAGKAVFVSSVRERQWVEERTLGSPDELYLAICLQATGEMIGYLSLIRIDRHNRSAEWGGIVIGEKALWNKGHATAAARLMLRHAFAEMGLHRVYGFWRADHAVSIRLAQKLGFTGDGIVRDAIFRGGKFHDAVLMSVLDQEFAGGKA